MKLQQLLAELGNPHTEARHRDTIAVCTDGLLVTAVSKLYDLDDYYVSAVCGPFTELRPRMSKPLEQRPELASLLAELRRLDANGWCIATDGSMDDITTDEAIQALQDTIRKLKQG